MQCNAAAAVESPAPKTTEASGSEVSTGGAGTCWPPLVFVAGGGHSPNLSSQLVCNKDGDRQWRRAGAAAPVARRRTTQRCRRPARRRCACGLRPPPPATSMWAAPGPRCSTGCTPRTWAAPWCCGEAPSPLRCATCARVRGSAPPCAIVPSAVARVTRCKAAVACMQR